LRILIIEDHDDSRAALQRLLEQDGHAVMSAHCVEAARAVSDTCEFDLVLGDIDLPDGDGCELMQELWETRGMRCIAVTGHSDEHHDQHAADCGIRVRLAKPIQFKHLLAAIEECMSNNGGTGS
jgi:DNA-binding response OmpR family regulator